MGTWQERLRAQAMLSRETGYVRKPHGGRLRVALAYPNTYHVGMSNLGFQAAYRLFNLSDEVACERVFLPPHREAPAPKRPSLLTLESQTPAGEMDVVAFSVSFEPDYPNVPRLLRLAGVPVFASDRTERHPLVVIGGAVTFLNPEPLAPFADIVACGEGEVLIPALITALRAASSRSDLFERLAGQLGFYVPALYDVRYGPAGIVSGWLPLPGTAATAPIRKAALHSTACVDPPATTIFTPDTEFGSRLLVEVVRGCAKLCRFCWAGYNYLPLRPFPAARILEIAGAAREHTDRAGLVSIALCEHPEIDRLLSGLRTLGYSLSPASLRTDDLTPPIVRSLVEGGERTITLAPETGSDRLRRVLNKNVTNAELLERTAMAFANGIENVKLYFMIGLPTETDEDLVAIRDLTVQVRDLMWQHARRRGRPERLACSVNPLVPKPGTPFQWLPMERPAATARKARRLRALVAGLDNVAFNIKSERHSHYQALLSLGDRRLAPAIAALEQHRGDWRAALAGADLDADFYVFRDRRADPVLPWDIVAGGPPRGFLRAEYEKSLHSEQSARRRPATGAATAAGLTAAGQADHSGPAGALEAPADSGADAGAVPGAAVS